MGRHLRTYVVWVLGALLAGCAHCEAPPKVAPTDLSAKIKAGGYVQKVDNFLVILDISASMEDPYRNYTKMAVAKELVQRMNQTIPPIKLQGGLRTFGPPQIGPDTKLNYGMCAYTREGLAAAVEPLVRPDGMSPLSGAIDAAAEDLKATSGKIAVIVVSDGEQMGPAEPKAAENLKKKYGDRICIYGILVGENKAGHQMIDQLAQAGGCGFPVTAESLLASSEAMAMFVENVFFDRIPIAAPSAQAEVKDVDTDGDGVFDRSDKCPGTPKGAKVNKEGCWVIEDVLFETAKWQIKPAAYPVLDNVVAVIKQNPDLKLEVQGHTDNVGSRDYNCTLSERRAMAVTDYLAAHGIEKARLKPVGYYFSRPVFPNTTPEGRRQNRRVELHPIH